MKNYVFNKGFVTIIILSVLCISAFSSNGIVFSEKQILENTNTQRFITNTIDIQPGFKTHKLNSRSQITTQYNQNKMIINTNFLLSEISLPCEGEVFRLGDEIVITGSTSIPGFEYYIIEWGIGQDPNQWSDDGITLVNGGSDPIEDGPLGFWDTEVAPETDYYSLKLSVFIEGSSEETFDVRIYLDSTLHENFPFGWPYEIPGSQVAIWSPISLKDVNNDGYQEIGFGTVTVTNPGDNNKDFIIDHMGNILDGWPIQFYGIQGSSLTFSNIDSSTDNIEVIGGMWGTEVFVWDTSGNEVEGWPQNIYAARASATVNDIDLDGDLEIILPCTDGGGYVYAWHHDGTLVDGWPVFIGSPVRRAASTADIDNDNYPEIMFGDQDGYFYVLNHDGTPADGWPKLANDWIKSSPITADIDEDGDLEIIISSGFTQPRKIFVWHHDGSFVDGWPQENGLSFVQPSVGDIDDDGDLEILAGGTVPTKPYAKFYVWHHDGTIADGWPIEFEYDPEHDVNYIYAQPVIGDIDGDDDVEIIVGSYGNKLYAWHHDATVVSGWPKMIGDSVDSTAAIGDIDKDDLIEVIVAGDDGKIYVWDLEAEYDPAKMEWPMFQHDIHHTGCYHTEIQENQPPENPDIFGPSSLKVNQEGTYTVSANDIDGNQVYFYIDWNDGDILEWDGPYDSSQSVKYKHTWISKENYTIKVKAKDTFDEVSDWTEYDIKITNPRIKFFNKIQMEDLFSAFTNLFPILNKLLNI